MSKEKIKKMINPLQVDHNNWVLLKDPKSKESQHIPLLSKSKIKKIQRRYTTCHGKMTSKVKEQMLRTEVVRPNPRFNREKEEEERKPQTSQEFEIEIERKDEEALTDVSKKLLSDDEGGFEGFELAIKEEEMS